MRIAIAILAAFALPWAWGCGDEAEPPTRRPTASSAASEGADDRATDVDPGEEGSADAGPAVSPLPTGKPIMIDFTRDHCLPCQIMAPWVEELRKKHAALVNLVEINIDRKENKPLARYFKARSIPTQVYVDERGREVSRHVGIATKPQMERTLKRLGFLDKPRAAEKPAEKKRKKRK
jgi:thioredoxin 1